MKIKMELTLNVDLEVIKKLAGEQAVEGLKDRAESGKLEKEFVDMITDDWEDDAATLNVEKLEIEMETEM